jgi:hypothetical protein
MELEIIKKIEISSKADVQYHCLMLIKSGIVIVFYSDDN